MRTTRIPPEVVLWLTATMAGLATAGPRETGIVYMGRLPLPDGAYDVRFMLYDSPTGANPQGYGVEVDGLVVADGGFMLLLDFGVAGPEGGAGWLEIGTRPAGSGAKGIYKALGPRRRIAAFPSDARSAAIFMDADDPLRLESTPSEDTTGGQAILTAEAETRYTAAEDPGNTFLGEQAGSNNTGTSNTFLGYQAGFSNTEGWFNTFTGYCAGYSNTTGNSNTFLGSDAGRSNTTGGRNTFAGLQAGYYNVDGGENTFSGYCAGRSNTTGNYNTFLGSKAGYFNSGPDPNAPSGGSYNTFAGNWAGYSNTTGRSNTFLGHMAGYRNLGPSAGAPNGGCYNTFSGFQTGIANTIGSYNTAIGSYAAISNTTGNDNTFLGAGAGQSNQTGHRNTYLGDSAGRENRSGSGSVFIGHQAGYWEKGSDKLYIANSSGTPLIYGDFATTEVGIGTTTPQMTLDVHGGIRWYGRYALDFTNNFIDRGYIQVRSGHDNNLYGISTWLSSRKAKKNITDLETDTTRIYDLRPVSFNWKTEEDDRPKSIGMIAEEVGTVLPQLVRYDEQGAPHHVAYELLSVLLLQELQKLRHSLVVADDGNMGIGTAAPQCALDIHGAVQAGTYLAGDIVFQREGKKRWRLFEDEDGLYVEKMDTRRVYSLIPKETDEAARMTGRDDLEEAIEKLHAENDALRQRLTTLEQLVSTQGVAPRPIP